MKIHLKVVPCLLLVLLFFAFSAAWCARILDGDPGTIGECIGLPDGSKVTLPCEEVLWHGKSGKSFGVKEWFEKQPTSHPRLVIVSTKPLPVSQYWSVDVTGVLSTFSGETKEGGTIRQRILIVSPENVTVYCDSQGKPFMFLPIKNIGMEWANKRSLADLAGVASAEKAYASTLSSGLLPQMPDSPYSASAPEYCTTIADAKAQYSSTSRNLVELHCRPFSGTTSTQFTLGQDSPSDSITVHYTGSSSLSGRINKIVGTIQKDINNNYWIEVDSGPNWTSGDFAGNVQSISSGTIAWSKTFADLTTLPSALTGKVVTRTFPSLGYFYIEETNRSSGIRVSDFSMASSVAIGDIVDVNGDLSSDDAERAIIASSTTITGWTTISPIGFNNRALAGGRFNALTPGAYNASGLNNVGLLVRAWGKVTSVGTDYFYFDDGSNCDDGSGATGVRVVGITGYMPSVNDYVAVTGISGLATYATDYARTIRLALSSDLSGISPTLPPANLTVASTGSGKITLYWDYVPGATGYNIYRGTASGGENYSSPVNGGTLVNTPTYSGSNVYTYTDTGLTNGTEYFYTVKAVVGDRESQASNESSDIPDASAIPWDSSNPSDVLSAVRAQYSNDPPQGSLRVAGPDGRIYEDGQSTVLPPDGTWITGTNRFLMADGSAVSQPDFPDSSSGSITILATTLPQHLGPYRRVRTTASYTGVRGDIYVPIAGNVFVNRNATYPNGQSTTDDIYILLGSTGSGEVDAGLQWSQVGSTKNGWNPYMISYPLHRPIINNPSSPRFTFDQYVNLKYRPRTTYPGIKRSVSLITIDSIDQGVTRSYGVYSVYKPNETVRVKRMHSIAQARMGAFRSGSYIQGVSWRSGQVRTSSGSWTNWTSGITNENGSSPAKGSIVNWFETSPYVAEDSIKVDLR